MRQTCDTLTFLTARELGTTSSPNSYVISVCRKGMQLLDRVAAWDLPEVEMDAIHDAAWDTTFQAMRMQATTVEGAAAQIKLLLQHCRCQGGCNPDHPEITLPPLQKCPGCSEGGNPLTKKAAPMVHHHIMGAAEGTHSLGGSHYV